MTLLALHQLLCELHLGVFQVRVPNVGDVQSDIVAQFGGFHELFSEIHEDLLVGDAVHLVEGGQSAL